MTLASTLFIRISSTWEHYNHAAAGVRKEGGV